jgi:hypothetical protein
MKHVQCTDRRQYELGVFHNLLLYPIILRENDIIISIYIICGAYNLLLYFIYWIIFIFIKILEFLIYYFINFFLFKLT